ncbi:helicase C-terminal domain-containing protein [Anaerolineales bacterium]
MHGILVALDLETTGLNVERDKIIEVAAVKIQNGEIIDKFTTLVNPQQNISDDISYITGINNDMVSGQPTIEVVIPQLEAFIGDSPVIAHNVSFDVSFLRRYHILKNNLPLDTLEIAMILIPNTSRYSLGELANYFNIQLENAHRALDDTIATAHLYWKLWETAIQLPPALLREILLSEIAKEWDLYPLFKAALESSEKINPDKVFIDSFPVYKPSDTKSFKPEIDLILDEASISEFFAADGGLGASIPAYEQRPQQEQMARFVREAFQEQKHGIIEAPTGTGKSMAYLYPAALWSKIQKKPVVISTNTISLQEQLINKDIELLKQSVNFDIKATVMKGRNNYLCPRLLMALRRRQAQSLDELRMLAKILVWMQSDQSGERNNISLRGGEWYVWARLNAENTDCHTATCLTQMGGSCPYYAAKQKAQEADIIITNHALLIADAMNGNSVLPEYDYLIIDEAHHLEDAITNLFSKNIDQRGVQRYLETLGTFNRGLLGQILDSLKPILEESEYLKFEGFISDMAKLVRDVNRLVQEFFEVCQQFILEVRSPSVIDPFFRITAKHRNKATFHPITLHWEKLDEYFLTLNSALEKLAKALVKIQKERDDYPSNEMANRLISIEKDLEETYTHHNSFTKADDDNKSYWFNVSRNSVHPGISSAPIHVGKLTTETLWQHKASVILTSATLKTGNHDFKYFAERLHLVDVDKVSLETPFDYKNSTVLFMPDDMAEPNNQRNYQRSLERSIISLASALEGRLMVLFTSYGHLRQTAHAVSPRLALGGIQVITQTSGGGQESLLEAFRLADKAVLMGTKSYWEGIDIPGDDLSGIIITRLPFQVPSDPIFAARAEQYQNAFQQFAIPEAVIRFRQGFGRLIRSRSDRGIIAVLDSRIINKDYGQQFIDALPDCNIHIGSTDTIGKVAEDWFKIE